MDDVGRVAGACEWLKEFECVENEGKVALLLGRVLWLRKGFMQIGSLWSLISSEDNIMALTQTFHAVAQQLEIGKPTLLALPLPKTSFLTICVVKVDIDE